MRVAGIRPDENFIMLKWIAAIFITLVSMGAHASFGEFLYAANRSAEAWLAGLEEKTATVNGVEWHYYARHAEKDNCIVLVHGFTAEAGNWFRFARHLPKDQCLIVPDLPGFGGSPYKASMDFTIPQQAKRLQSFVNAIAPNGKRHLAGSSMGGHIVATYALLEQSRIASLTLFDAAGVQSPVKSEANFGSKKKGRNPFDIKSREDFEKFLPWTMHDIPWMPSVVQAYLADGYIERNNRYQSILKTIYGKDMLDARLQELHVPTLVVWGEKDRLLNVSMAEVYHQGIKGSKKIVYPGLGHLPFLEDSSRAAADYNRFLDGITQQKN